MVPHLRTPILNCFDLLLWFYFLTDPEFSCLAMLAKPYPVSGPTYMPHIPNLLHCMLKGAHGVLETISEASTLVSFPYKNHVFYPFVIESLYLSPLCLSAALL